jgi:hypothetical protein
VTFLNEKFKQLSGQIVAAIKARYVLEVFALHDATEFGSFASKSD